MRYRRPDPVVRRRSWIPRLAHPGVRLWGVRPAGVEPQGVARHDQHPDHRRRRESRCRRPLLA